jgi:hypothetical protein
MLQRLICGSVLVGLALAVPGAPALGQDLARVRGHAPDSALREVVTFLETDSAVQAAPRGAGQFLLIEEQEGRLRVVARVASKVDLHVLGRRAGDLAISGLFPRGVVASSRVEYYVFRPAAGG